MQSIFSTFLGVIIEFIATYSSTLMDILFAVLIFAGIFIIRFVFFSIVLKKIDNLLANTKHTLLLTTIDNIKAPINFFFLALCVMASMQMIDMPLGLSEFIHKIFNSIVLAVIFWIFYCFSSFVGYWFTRVATKSTKRLRQDISHFIETLYKIFIWLMTFVIILQEWGYNINGLIASLGIGGLAFALAAKDTVANIFGYLIVFTESPFEVGDWIKINDLEGTVEEINIRSTKIRTFGQSLISLPNVALTNSSIENFSKMGKRRIKMQLGLTYSTSVPQMQSIIAQIKAMLLEHTDIDKGTVFIYFTDFDHSSLNIFCYFFTITTNWGEYLSVREDVNFKIMQIVADNEAQFAFPSRSIYLEKGEAE